MSLESEVFIIEADGKINDTNGYGTPIQCRLKEMGIDAEIVNIENHADKLKDLPPGRLIFSGGMTEVTADVNWVIEAKNIVQQFITENRRKGNNGHPMLGICFGAQLIAEAYAPGSVTFLEDPEIGISSIELETPKHPLFEGVPNPFDAYSFHYNQIWSDDLVALSISNHKGHRFLQAFEIEGANSYGVQFHPEFRVDEMKTLYRNYRELIADFGFDLQPVIDSLQTLENNWRILSNFVLHTT